MAEYCANQSLLTFFIFFLDFMNICISSCRPSRFCKELDRVWVELAKDYGSSEEFFVAEVDCTFSGKMLCFHNRVDSYPTIMYGDPKKNLQLYTGELDYETLTKFIAEEVNLPCSAKREMWCKDDDHALLYNVKGMSFDQLSSKIRVMKDEMGKGIRLAEEKMDSTEKISEMLYEKLNEAQNIPGNTKRLNDAMEAFEKAELARMHAEEEYKTIVTKPEPLELRLMIEVRYMRQNGEEVMF
mmetsp:Transcript_28411/g.64994  ORF Transcript_28411/g.64994 Transcript_28411/m.64994 type:complete len:241 (-) Transcript_28411:133-855(-)